MILYHGWRSFFSSLFCYALFQSREFCGTFFISAIDFCLQDSVLRSGGQQKSSRPFQTLCLLRARALRLRVTTLLRLCLTAYASSSTGPLSGRPIPYCCNGQTRHRLMEFLHSGCDSETMFSAFALCPFSAAGALCKRLIAPTLLFIVFAVCEFGFQFTPIRAACKFAKMPISICSNPYSLFILTILHFMVDNGQTNV